ncbi:FRG domain-containing protein [Microbacterium sp. CGR1]|uniref:FRG domain-containing protein n=1 Tax=Microbacterium sp. CGR1 TaxID=1696072 RepID=UPI003DA32962
MTKNEPEGDDTPGDESTPSAADLGAEEVNADDLASGPSTPSGFTTDQYGAFINSILLGSEAVRGMREQMAATLAPAIRSMQEQVAKSAGTFALGIEAYNRAMLPSAEVVTALARQLKNMPALTRPGDFDEPSPPQGPYSDVMDSPRSYFQATEEVIESFDDLHAAITKLISKTPELPLVWRGVRSADWGLHSYLYRHLMEVNGVVPPAERPTEPQPYPDEDQMVAAEREVLRIARSDWRFDNLSALETFARVQHFGGPTRLIDVTKNPYIGAWFAIELDATTESDDARLFALATKPVSREGKQQPPDSALSLDDLGAARDPFWHLLETNADRQLFEWGTGARRRVWVPPAYDPRISAQNAAFILDGVPITSSKLAPYFKIEGSTYWRRNDLLASASIYAKMFQSTAKPRYNARNFAPTFSFRISAEAKREIREVMESRFGYRRSYIYPDMSGLASHLKSLPLDGSAG